MADDLGIEISFRLSWFEAEGGVVVIVLGDLSE